MSGEFRSTNVVVKHDDITINAVKCLGCGRILVSNHTHDFRQCRCPNQTFVDGGLEYQRFGGVDMNLVRVYTDGGYKEVGK